MRCRIYKRRDEVVVYTPSSKYQGDNFDECKHPSMFINDPYDSVETKTFDEMAQITQGKNESGNSQFYFEGETLKHDHKWEELVMPRCCIISRHRAALDKELEDELLKEIPDPVAVVKKDRELKKLSKLSMESVYALALDKLVKENKKHSLTGTGP